MKPADSFDIARYIVERKFGPATVNNIYQLNRVCANIMINQHGIEKEKANEICEAFKCRVFYEHTQSSKSNSFNFLNI